MAVMVASSTEASEVSTVGTSPRSLTSTSVLPLGLMSGWMATVDQKPAPALCMDVNRRVRSLPSAFMDMTSVA